jgi:hypothetical protein
MPRYWFRQKTFGYGATPNTWQGWALTLGSLALVMALLLGTNRFGYPLGFLLKVVAAPLVLIASIVITYRKTEGGWRWRNGDE